MKKSILFTEALPSPEEVAQQEQLVRKLQVELNKHFGSPDVEEFRSKWAKARAKLSNMQGLLYFSGHGQAYA